MITKYLCTHVYVLTECVQILLVTCLQTFSSASEGGRVTGSCFEFEIWEWPSSGGGGVAEGVRGGLGGGGGMGAASFP